MEPTRLAGSAPSSCWATETFTRECNGMARGQWELNWIGLKPRGMCPCDGADLRHLVVGGRHPLREDNRRCDAPAHAGRALL